MSEPASDEAIEAALKTLPGWSHEDGALKKTYQFGAFPEAISFITRIAFEAEQRGHHPEIRNVYSTVEIALKTHDAGDVVTDKDTDLAQVIEKISWV
ncbi:MAG: 4a-hydroxytetrahydrobiopterin dehydratase [Sandaracinaceae bacterium]